MAVAAPVIVAEMADWTALGGGNSGIVGDGAHGSGFHRAASEVSATDYSRRRDPNGADGPYVDWRYACAGDFRHGGDPDLRRMHREVLARLMRGELPVICEFIGKPWEDRPVYYWARWNGVGTLALYTGRGHDLWSHIAWYRSRVDQRAHLWVPAEGGDMFVKQGDSGEGVRYLQLRLVKLGYLKSDRADGVYGKDTAAALAAAEAAHGTKTNGSRASAATWTRLDELFARKHAGQPGARGPEGPRGPAGPQGPKGEPGQVDHRMLAREAIGLAAELHAAKG